MGFSANRLPYRQTGYFSKTVLDYIDQAPAIKPFFAQPPTLQGIQKAIEARKNFSTDRKLLIGELKKQYESVSTATEVLQNIESLLSPETFTITTAHQNNIFTGPLYFIYKIIHTIRLATYLKESLPQYNFVPVYYVGAEDADLDELNHIYLNNEKLTWDTKQTGTVGRMKVDKELVKLRELIEGQLGIEHYGKEIAAILKECYKEGNDIQTATFRFVNELFGKYGLIVLLPDNAVFKKQVTKIFKDDLLNQTASGIVEHTIEELEKAGYKAQANPREVNLFYLQGDIRERIEHGGEEWQVVNEKIKFSKEELFKELEEHPERFSPNVILRGLYQSTILPDVAFIGGGGEVAYWLQLQKLFIHYKTPYPVLVLRNSFLIVEKKWQEKIAKLGFEVDDFFSNEDELMKKLVVKESKNEIKLNGALMEIEQLYTQFKEQANAIDSTLSRHVDALKLQTVQRLQKLEKKMYRAEKRKFADRQRQIQAIRSHLFPQNGLQERYDNICYYYAKWGKDFIKSLYENSLSLEQEFVVLNEK